MVEEISRMEWERRAAENQSLFRSVNERVEDIAASGENATVDFVCECLRTDCVERIRLTLAEYEEVRSVPTHFAVMEGHEDASLGRVVVRTDRYLIVEKFDMGGVVAAATDPRKHSERKETGHVGTGG